MNTIKLNIPNYDLTDEQFYELCQANDSFSFERSPSMQLMVMEPTGGYSGTRNTSLLFELELWNRETKLGVVFDSSTGFRLSNGAIYSPDVAWLAKERWDALNEEEKEKFLPLCPDFLIELKSKSDRIEELQDKMQHYLDCGLNLGWLIDPYEEKVYIYIPNKKAIISPFSEVLNGNKILPGFELNLSQLFGFNQ